MLAQIFKVFITVFLAELGDKTQLAVVGFAAGGNQWATFIGASLALVAVTAVGTIAGKLLGNALPAKYIQIGSGALFIIIGAIYIIKGVKGA